MTDYTEELEKKSEERCRALLRSDKAYNGLSNTDFWIDGYAQGYEDCRHYAHDYYKPKWHDLREDPKDLPEHKNSSVNRICWINEYGNKCYHDAFYDNKGFYWVSEKTCAKYYPVINVIAWTKLPEFKEQI